MRTLNNGSLFAVRTFFEQRSVGEWLALTASVLVIVGIVAAVLGS